MVDVMVDVILNFIHRVLRAALLGYTGSHFLWVVVLPFCLIVCPFLAAFWVIFLYGGLIL